MRLNCVDHYQATPSEMFDPPLPYGFAGRERPRVPVVRVFGSMETGQKVCVHVHGVFPYLYVEYDGSLNPEEGVFNGYFLFLLFITILADLTFILI